MATGGRLRRKRDDGSSKSIHVGTQGFSCRYVLMRVPPPYVAVRLPWFGSRAARYSRPPPRGEVGVAHRHGDGGVANRASSGRR